MTRRFSMFVKLSPGGFKFQVQRVNDGAVAHRLPGAWQSSDIFLGACSADGDGVQLALGVARQIRALGKYWRSRPLVFSLVPRCRGCADRQRRSGSRAAPPTLVLGHLFAPIVGQRFPQWGRHVPEFLREALVGTPGIRPAHPGQQTRRVVRSTKVPTADRLRAPLMRSPSQWPGTVRVVTSAGRSAIGVMLGIWPRRSSLRPRPTGLAGLTQGGQQFAPQRPPRQHVQPHVDGFGREVFPHVVRIRASEASGNLLGRAALVRCVLTYCHSQGSRSFLGAPWLTGSGRRVALRRTGPIGAAPRVYCGPTRGSRCWGPAPTSSPSSAANGRGSGPGSRSHGLQHSSVV